MLWLFYFGLVGSFCLCFKEAWKGIKNDFMMIHKDPALESSLEILFCYPGFWALFFYRLSHVIVKWKIPLIPRIIMGMIRIMTAVDIHPRAKISDEGVFIDHATGVVIGETAEIGAGTTIYHQVTLGGTGKIMHRGQRRHPIVGKNCMIGAGAKLLGAITIGDNCQVGANSVVTKSIPDNCTALGIPATVVRKVKCPLTMNDPVSKAVCELHRRVVELEEALDVASKADSCADLLAAQEQANEANEKHWHKMRNMLMESKKNHVSSGSIDELKLSLELTSKAPFYNDDSFLSDSDDNN